MIINRWVSNSPTDERTRKRGKEMKGLKGMEGMKGLDGCRCVGRLFGGDLYGTKPDFN